MRAFHCQLRFLECNLFLIELQLCLHNIGMRNLSTLLQFFCGGQELGRRIQILLSADSFTLRDDHVVIESRHRYRETTVCNFRLRPRKRIGRLRAFVRRQSEKACRHVLVKHAPRPVHMDAVISDVPPRWDHAVSLRVQILLGIADRRQASMREPAGGLASQGRRPSPRLDIVRNICARDRWPPAT